MSLDEAPAKEKQSKIDEDSNNNTGKSKNTDKNDNGLRKERKKESKTLTAGPC